MTPIVISKYWYLSQFCYVKVFSTKQAKTLLLLDDPSRVRSQITSVVCQIQRFDFDRNLVDLDTSDAKSNNTELILEPRM
jgi:hypothetical protein